MIAQWWTSLDPSMKVLWAITLTSSLIFVIQSVLTFLGIGADADFDLDAADGDVDGMGLLTFRNLVNFCLGFGWSAVLLKDEIASTAVLIVVSVIIGVVLVALVMMLFKWLGGMQESGNIDIRKSAVGCEGKVYLTIPAERTGAGKVQITINNAVREYEALTDGAEIPTGREIKVVEVVGSDTLLVEEMNSLII